MSGTNPTGVVASDISETGFIIGWKAPSPVPEAYVVQYRVDGTTPWLNAPPLLSLALAGLQPGTSYDVQVVAVSASGAAAASSAIETKTIAAPTPPAAPIAPVYIGMSSGSFTDSKGNEYSLLLSGIVNGTAMENGKPIPGGYGTSQMALYNGQVYGQDAATKSWWIWTGTGWVGAAAP